MQSNHGSVGDTVKTVERPVAVPSSNFQVIVGAEISLTLQLLFWKISKAHF